MSQLRQMLNDYLAMRRGLGFKLRCDGTALQSFVDFMERKPAETIVTELALEWAKQPSAVRPERLAQRLSYVRSFARYCIAFDDRTEIPSSQLLPFPARSPKPYIFTDEDIKKLLQDALQLPTKDELSRFTYHNLFGLLSGSGLRIGEALGLTVDDVDLETGILTLRSTKFGKSRLVPLHATTVAVLADYHQRRDRYLAGRTSESWFVNAQGKRLSYDSANHVFHQLTAALPDQRRRKRPRLHDLRHYFAIATVVRWYRDGEDVERRLPVLSTFLGHVEVRDTYWYLSACPGLLEVAKGRLERRWESPR